MKKLVIFDLDGVLLDSKLLHFNALNEALALVDPTLIITESEQKKLYEGLPTKSKLQLLTKFKGLNKDSYDFISERKQEITLNKLSILEKDSELISMLSRLKDSNLHIAVASNSIRATVVLALERLGISELVEVITSNEDVANPKPHPEMYWKTMSIFGVISEETVIFEDSLVGKMAARDSKAKLIEVIDRQDLTQHKITEAINYLAQTKTAWRDGTLNVLIPMAGHGSRFVQAGYAFPKPLVEVENKPMIQAVVESLGIEANYIYIVQKEHFEKFNLAYLLNLITPDCKIISIDGVTEGAAITSLMAKEYINNDSPLIIANSDQIIDWSSRDFIYSLMSRNADGGILTFTSTHPKWSYAKINERGEVVEVAEKKPISNLATVGVYYWRYGSDYVRSAESMIAKDIRTNNEFYVCPTYNELISEGKLIYTYNVDEMFGVGTPEDLNYYLSKKKGPYA